YNPAANNWTAVSATGAPAGRYLHSAVWTGAEMLIWGGFYFSGGSHYLNDGARYDPAGNSWTPIGATALGARGVHTAVWSGSEMLVWGGYNGSAWFNDGARYNPTSHSWSAMTNSGAPVARYVHTAVW